MRSFLSDAAGYVLWAFIYLVLGVGRLGWLWFALLVLLLLSWPA